MFFKIITAILLSATITSYAMANDQTHNMIEEDNKEILISGKIVDHEGRPVIGASITLNGKKAVATSDADGKFLFHAISLPAPSYIQVTYLGMEAKKITLQPPYHDLLIRLNDKINVLGEVVSTGYNRLLKRRSAGSFAVVTHEQIENQVPTSIDKILQGQIAGVHVSVPNGKPGESAQVRIRGVNTVNGSAEPLWVVDGVIMQDNLPKVLGTNMMNASDFNDIFRNGIGDINPNDIESITILKDAVASAIYGSRSAGGVISITTKRGKVGKPRVNYSTLFTIGLYPQRQENIMNAEEKIRWEQELWNEFSAKPFKSGNGWYPVIGIVGMIHADKIGRNGKLWTENGFEKMTEEEKSAYIEGLKRNNVNWYDEIFRNSLSQNHNLSLSGGAGKMDYYTSLSYTKNMGLVKRNDYQRYTFNMKINVNPTSKLKLGFKSTVSFQKSGDFVSSVDPFRYAYFANPYETPYNADGSYRADMTYFNLTQINAGDASLPYIPTNGFNILREMNETSSCNTKLGINIQGTFDYFLTNNLKFTGIAAYGRNNTNGTDELGKNTYAAFMNRLPWDMQNREWKGYGILRQNFNEGNNFMGRLMLRYAQDFRKLHHIVMIGGCEIRSAKNQRSFMMQYGYDPETKITGMPEPPEKGNMSYSEWKKLIDDLSSSQWDEQKYASFFTTVDYDFNNTYTLNAALRTDGSNNFGTKEQFNPTYSVGAAWNIDNERFWRSIKPVINRLTMRVSYGFTGNVVQGMLKSLVINTGRKKWNGHITGTVKNAPNPHLRWERTRDMKLGIDMGMFNNRLNINTEIYEKLGSDIITKVGTVSTTGFTTLSFNTSKIRNRGLEISIYGTPVKTKKLTLSTSVNLSWNRNELVEFVAPLFGISNGKYQGYPLDAIFNGITTGIDKETGYYNMKTVPNAKFETIADKKNVANYKFYLGTRNAPYSGGGSINVSYEGFTFSAQAAYSIGGKVLNEINSPVNYSMVGYSRNNTPQTSFSDIYTNHLNVARDRMDRWTTENREGTKYPRIVDAFGAPLNLEGKTVTGSNITDGIYLQEISFLRIRNISLSYHFNKNVTETLGLSNLGITCSAQNFFTFTNFRGIDPEQPGLTYPITRSVTFGLQIGF